MAKVLIIEDSNAQAAIISEIVTNAGHEPVVHQEFKKSIAQVIQAINPDLVLLDLTLLGADGKPVADGFQICREIKRVSKKQVAVIIVSAKDAEQAGEWAILQGADAFLQKPFAVEDLVAVITDVLQKPSSSK